MCRRAWRRSAKKSAWLRKLSSRVNAQARLELYNLTGAVQFGQPVTNTNNFTTFGTVANNQANDPGDVPPAVEIQRRLS